MSFADSQSACSRSTPSSTVLQEVDDPALAHHPFGPLSPSLVKYNILYQSVVAVLEFDTEDFLIDICAAILEFGGAYRLDLNQADAVTHVVCGSRTLSSHTETLLKTVPRSIPIVSAQWIIDCCNWRRRLSTKPFSLFHQTFSSLSKSDISETGTWYSMKNLHSVTSPVFSKRSFYLHADIPEKYVTRIMDIILKNGGSISRIWPVDENVDMCIFRYAQSSTFIEAINLGHNVASLYWLIDAIRLEDWTDPLDSVLHFPYPRRRHHAFPQIVACITGFLGRDRDYCKELLKILGVRYGSDLNRDTTVLIAAKPEGRKFQVSTGSSWKRVHTVNVAWLEDSVQLGEPQDTLDPMYTLFHRNPIDAPGVGIIPVSQSTVHRILKDAQLAIEKQESLNTREYKSLIESAGKIGEAVTAPNFAAGRQAKQRGIHRVHDQYLELDKLSRSERESVLRTWELGDAEFRLGDAGHNVEDQCDSTQHPNPNYHESAHISDLLPGDMRTHRLLKRPHSPKHSAPESRISHLSRLPETPTGPDITSNPKESVSSSNSTRQLFTKGPAKIEVVIPLMRQSSPLIAKGKQPNVQNQSLIGNTPLPQNRLLPRKSQIRHPVVMLSRYNPPASLQEQLSHVGVQIMDVPTVSSTHLVINKTSYAERFLLGLATCQYLVTSDWLDACAHAGYPVDEQPYLLHDKTFESEVKMTVTEARNKLQSGPMLRGKGLSAAPDQFHDPGTIQRLAIALCATAVPYGKVAKRKDLVILVIVDPEISKDELSANGLLQDHIQVAVVDQLTCAIRCGQFNNDGLPI